MEKKKRKRYQRREAPATLRLQERDIDIVEAVHLHRVLKQEQIQLLFFGPGNKSGAQRRLEKLYDHGYLERKFMPVSIGEGRSPTLYVLDRKGVELLRAERGFDELTWYSTSKELKSDFLAHALAINDVMVAVTQACRECGYTLETWRGESQIKADYDRATITLDSGRKTSVAVVPDSYFTIVANDRRHHFFLELDRGRMTVKRFKTKIAAYVAYHKGGDYQRRYGARGLRVLTVIDGGVGRMANLKAAAEDAYGAKRYWFALLSQLSAATVISRPIWHVATQEKSLALIE